MVKDKVQAKRISRARTVLLLDFPWFGSLSMNLRIVETEAVPTFGVDGTTMVYNPEFSATLDDKELAGVVAHEVMHCALGHIYRREHRNPLLWNIAADYAINLELTEAGLTLPKGALLDSQYKNMSAEVIYSKLKQEIQQSGGKGKPKDGSGATGSFSDPADGDKKDGQKDSDGGDQPKPRSGMSEDDWKIAAQQAASVAKAAGKLPASIERLVQESRASKTDWRQELKEFLQATVPNDYSWLNPNRRYIHQGTYLPGTVKENFGKLAIAVDTSGSIHQGALNAFAAEISAIASELHPEAIDIIYCDAAVQHIQHIEGDTDVKLEARGGGGTAFNPVFEEVAKWEEPPVALLYFTDLECYDKPVEQPYPVLWVTDHSVTHEAPFGRVIRVEID